MEIDVRITAWVCPKEYGEALANGDSESQADFLKAFCDKCQEESHFGVQSYFIADDLRHKDTDNIILTLEMLLEQLRK